MFKRGFRGRFERNHVQTFVNIRLRSSTRRFARCELFFCFLKPSQELDFSSQLNSATKRSEPSFRGLKSEEKFHPSGDR